MLESVALRPKLAPAVPALAQKPVAKEWPPLQAGLRAFEDNAQLSFLSLGKNGSRFFMLGVLTSVSVYPWLSQIKGFVLWGVSKVLGRAAENKAIAKVEENLKTAGDKAILNVQLLDMEPAVALRLSQRSKVVQESLFPANRIMLAVENFKKNFASSIFSLGAGKAFFVLAAIWEFPLDIFKKSAEVIVNTLQGYALLELIPLAIIAKIIGKVVERASVKKVAGLIKTDEEKAVLKEAMQDLSARQEKVLAKKLSKQGVVI